MSVQTRNRQPAPAVPVQPTVESTQVRTTDPWDWPTIEVTFSQLPSSRWTASRTVKWNNLDVSSPEAVQDAQQHLEVLDDMIRQHIAELYEKDSIERDAYFRSKQQQGGGYGGSNY